MSEALQLQDHAALNDERRPSRPERALRKFVIIKVFSMARFAR
jgi:hypothetical protein